MANDKCSEDGSLLKEGGRVTVGVPAALPSVSNHRRQDTLIAFGLDPSVVAIGLTKKHGRAASTPNPLLKGGEYA